MVEVYTYWRGDLVDVRLVPAETARRLRDGVFTHTINERPLPRELLVGDQPDWGFWRILAILGIAYFVVMIGLAITPDPRVKYVLWEPVGTMKLARAGTPEGDRFDRLYAARPHLPSAGTTKRNKRTGPLISSPPGSRTYQAPPEPELVSKGLLALLRAPQKEVSIFGTADIDTLGALDSGVASSVAYGGLGYSSGVESRGERYGVVGGVREGVIGGVVGRGEGIGLGSVGTIGRGAYTITEKDDDDVIYRTTTCREIVEIVREAAAELEVPLENPPRRSALLAACRAADRTAMTCVTKAADRKANRKEILAACAADLPEIFLDALASHRPAVE